MGLLPRIAATGARVLFPIIGGAATAGTTLGAGTLAGLAAGGAAGEFTAQAIEKAFGGRKEFEALPIAGEAALGAAMGPISSARRALQAGKAVSSLGRLGSRVPGLAAGAGEGALVGGLAQTVSSATREGRLPTAGELALGVGTGGVLGGALGGLQKPPQSKPTAGLGADDLTRAGQAEKPASVLGLEDEIQKTEKAINKIVGRRDRGHYSPLAVKELKGLRAKRVELKERLRNESILARQNGEVPGQVSQQALDDAVLKDQFIRATAGESDPVLLENVQSAGQALKKAFEEGFEQGLDPSVILNSTAAGQAGLRINRAIDELISSGQVGALQGDALKQQFSPFAVLNSPDFAKALSASAKTMNVAGQISKLFKSYVLSDPFEQEIQKAQKFGLGSYLDDLLQLRRAGLVVPFPTAMRNVTSQVFRYTTEMATDAVRGLMGDKTASYRARAAFQGLLSPRQARSRMVLLQEATDEAGNALWPKLQKELLRFHAGNEGGARKIFGGRWDQSKIVDRMQVMNFWMNTASDDFIRNVSAESFVRAEMKALGQLDAYLANPAKALGSLAPLRAAKILEKATRHAQEISFAEPPAGFFKSWSGLVERHPVLTLATPFPRFMGSAFSFIKRHNPAGLLRAYTQDNASSPEALREVYARALTGTALLAAGFALKSQYFKGDKPLEFRDPESGRVIDVKSFMPLTFGVALADVVLALADGKKPSEIPFSDLKEALFGIGRFSDAVPATFQLLVGQGDVAGAQEYLETIAGDFLGGFARPGIALRDTLEGLYGYERSVDKRATQKGRILGGFASQVPFGGELFDIPPVINPTTGKDVAETRPVKFMGVTVPAPIFRHLSGLNIRDRTAVESELIRLQIDPFKKLQSTRLGDDQLEGAELATTQERNLARTLMGPLVAGRLAPKLEAIKQARDEEGQRMIVDGIVSRAARDAKARAKLMFRQQDPRAALTIIGSQSLDRSPRRKSQRDAARRALASKFEDL